MTILQLFNFKLYIFLRIVIFRIVGFIYFMSLK